MFASRFSQRCCVTPRRGHLLTFGGKSSVRQGHHRDSLVAKDDIKIKELISSLKKDERRELYTKLRSILGEDEINKPTTGLGSLVSIMQRGKARIKKYIDRPTMSQLNRLFMYHSLPYIAFGFLDNSIMIMAGDYIESTIGKTIGISTLASAGLGNAMADALSIGMAYHVERFFSKLVQGPKTMTVSQYELRTTRIVIQSARIFGITLGCLLGLTPLYFINKQKKNPQSENQINL